MMAKKISICIPTYNRAEHLANCLQSIILNAKRAEVDFEVCVSDNGSTDETESVVRHMQADIDIRYRRQVENVGIPRNFLDVVEMANGEFVWLIGDDDLLLPYALEEISNLITGHQSIDYFYVNSSHLTTEYIASFPQPFDTANLPKDMIPFSSFAQSGEMSFMKMVDPKVSFDFLGGMFLSVFKRRKWLENVHVLDSNAISDKRTFSHFDNTFPHVKIFSNAFAKSQAYFYAKPLSVCLTGAREWAPMYPFVRSVRLVEALIEYRKNGLPYFQYLRCRNSALKYFLPDIVFMFIHKRTSGLGYINPCQSIFSNILYPNFYFSLIAYLARKMKFIITKLWQFLYHPLLVENK